MHISVGVGLGTFQCEGWDACMSVWGNWMCP